ncbi:MAG: AAA family ATPase, partial [Gemmatimonadetes bacterium]|nr:AAA family ATPase [Gemmatimonadota bacterium]
MLRTQVLSPLLVGREAELEALEALLLGAAAGTGSTALVAGDAGIGKSRLCRELKARATREGIRVIEGRSSPAESSVPYGPFMDALRFRIARGEGEQAARFLEPVIGRVAPLFAELSELGTPGAAAEATDVTAAFEAIFRVLQRLAAHGPVLVLLEDIHWTDPTSHDLLHYLARRIGDEPLLLVATFRTDELHPGHPVHRLAAMLGRERVAHRLDLDPLSEPEVRSMLAAMLGIEPTPGFAEAVWRRTEGNPLFVEEVLSGLVQTRPQSFPAFDAEDLADAALPATINDIVLSRIEPLGPDAVEALQVAAVIGRRFRFDVLAAALDWPDDRLLPVVERAMGQRILVEEQGGAEEAYAFRHSLAQEVLYGATIGRRKRVWHRRVAAALETTDAARGLPHTTLAHHYRLGGDPGRARRHAVLAGDEAARLCAWSDAEAFYEEALAALEHGPRDAALEAEVVEKLAEVAWWQNRPGASEQYAQEALELHRSLGDRPRMAALLRRLAALYAYQHGDTGRSVAMLRHALAVLDDEAPAERIFLMNDLGRLHLARGEFTEA